MYKKFRPNYRELTINGKTGKYLVKNDDDGILRRSHHTFTCNQEALKEADGQVVYLHKSKKTIAIRNETIEKFLELSKTIPDFQRISKDNQTELRARVPISWWTELEPEGPGVLSVKELSAKKIEDLYHDKKYKRNGEALLFDDNRDRDRWLKEGDSWYDSKRVYLDRPLHLPFQ